MVRKILVVGEGNNEIGPFDEWGQERAGPGKSPLANLVDRILGDGDRTYCCKSFKDATFRAHGAKTRGLMKRAEKVIFHARRNGFDGCVILIDKDRNTTNDTLRPLEQASENLADRCAVGVAVETFDAWMICDPNAVKAMGGDKSHCHPQPERLQGTEASGNHPKSHAKRCFPGMGLTDAYCLVATKIDLDHLKKQCPQGFGAFEKEVRQQLAS